MCSSGLPRPPSGGILKRLTPRLGSLQRPPGCAGDLCTNNGEHTGMLTSAVLQCLRLRHIELLHHGCMSSNAPQLCLVAAKLGPVYA